MYALRIQQMVEGMTHPIPVNIGEYVHFMDTNNGGRDDTHHTCQYSYTNINLFLSMLTNSWQAEFYTFCTTMKIILHMDYKNKPFVENNIFFLYEFCFRFEEPYRDGTQLG